MNTNQVANAMIDVGRLSGLFSQVNRATFHEDGVTKESDSDHTVMLGLTACAFASSYMQDLSVGRVAQFAFVHDLVEAYAGDTNSLGIASGAQISKEEKEYAAYLRIADEFRNSLPWIPDTILEYESLESKEARFVKAFDKIMPKITQTLNKGVQFRQGGKTKEELISIHQKQANEMSAGYARDMPEVIALLEEMMRRAEEVC